MNGLIRGIPKNRKSWFNDFVLLIQKSMSSGDMVAPERLDLKWFDFQSNASVAFRKLRGGREFSDVTLVSGDGLQVEAHRVILASSSNFFRNILEKTLNSRPLIFLRGVSMVDLTALVDFIYLGETSIQRENIEAFLALAKELGLKGVEDNSAKEEQMDKIGDRFPVMAPSTSVVSGQQSSMDRESDNAEEEFLSKNDIINGPALDGGINDIKPLINLQDSGDTDEESDQPIVSKCHQSLSVKDAVELIQKKSCGAVRSFPPRPESGTIWRFRTDK